MENCKINPRNRINVVEIQINNWVLNHAKTSHKNNRSRLFHSKWKEHLLQIQFFFLRSLFMHNMHCIYSTFTSTRESMCGAVKFIKLQIHFVHSFSLIQFSLKRIYWQCTYHHWHRNLSSFYEHTDLFMECKNNWVKQYTQLIEVLELGM